MSDFPFTRGYALATALIMRTHHDECITREVALSFGGGGDGGLRALWVREGVDASDLEAIDVAFTGGSQHERESWHGKAVR